MLVPHSKRTGVANPILIVEANILVPSLFTQAEEKVANIAWNDGDKKRREDFGR
jgi:hypothetical protein